MKKLILSLVFVFATSSILTAKSIDNNSSTIFEKHLSVDVGSNIDKSVIILNEYTYSPTCWVFKRWLISKLREVSDNEELIQETASALKEICEIANDLGLI
jgi:hypothetical protein